MFSESVFEDMLTGREGNLLMPSVDIRDWRFFPDASFVITLRMLLYPRLTKEDNLTLHTHSTMVRTSFGGENDRYLRDWFFAYNNVHEARRNTLTLITLEGNSDGIKRLMNAINDNFNTYSDYTEDFVPMNDIKAFFAPCFDAVFFINEERHNTVIVAKNPTIEHYHYLQTVCSRLLPWFFNDKPLNEAEKELIKSLADKNGYALYDKYVKEFLEMIDFRSLTVRRVVDGFNIRALKSQLESIESRINSAERDMRDYLSAYARMSGTRDDLISRQTGVRMRIEESKDNTELLDYFLHNEGLHPIHSGERDISFLVTTYLDSFDPDLYQTVSRNVHSPFYTMRSCREELNIEENRLKLLDAIFGDEPTIRIRTMAYFWLDIQGNVESESYYEFPRKLEDTHIPNPHLFYHNCLGQNAPAIVEALSEGDLTGAVAQCIAATANINIGEEPTVRPFLEKFLNTESKCLEFSDGTLCDPLEALEKLTKESENKTEEEEDNGETN